MFLNACVQRLHPCLKHTRIGFKSFVYRLDNEYMKPFDHLKESKCLSNNQNLKMKVAFLSLSENKISAEQTNYSGKLPLAKALTLPNSTSQITKQLSFTCGR